MPVVTPEDLEEFTTVVSDPAWDYLSSLQQSLGGAQPAGKAAGAHSRAPSQGTGTAVVGDVAVFRTALSEGDNRLKQRFLDDEPVERLVRDRARLVDALLRTAWQLHAGEYVREIALIAVGGYGRGELNLCSDIDIMILLPKSEATPW